MVIPLVVPNILPLYYFPVLLMISIIGCIAGTLLTAPTDTDTLIDFYVKVRPWGFWKPVAEKAKARYPGLKSNSAFGRDMFNVTIGIVWQCCLTLIPMYIVLQKKLSLFNTIVVLIITSLILKKNWYDKMCKDEKEYHLFMNRIKS